MGHKTVRMQACRMHQTYMQLILCQPGNNQAISHVTLDVLMQPMSQPSSRLSRQHAWRLWSMSCAWHARMCSAWRQVILLSWVACRMLHSILSSLGMRRCMYQSLEGRHTCSLRRRCTSVTA